MSATSTNALRKFRVRKLFRAMEGGYTWSIDDCDDSDVEHIAKAES